jgi:sulfonate transport system substrate-binding protein
MRRVPIAMLAALALALAALVAATRAPAEPITIRVGNAGIGPGGSRFVPGLVGLIGAEKYLEREFDGDPDVKIEWFYFKGAGPAVNEALRPGIPALGHAVDPYRRSPDAHLFLARDCGG